MPIIKEAGLLSYRTSMARNLEDWREERREKPWAVHCVEHDFRRFYPTLKQAKDHVCLPDVCPKCNVFEQRCIYCPSAIEEWKLDSDRGFTRSLGHILGRPVCGHHCYGEIPEGIEYLQVKDVVQDKAVIEIFIGAPFIGEKVLTLQFQNGDHQYWARFKPLPEYITEKSLFDISSALQFGARVLQILNSPSGLFKPWEEFERPS